MNEAERRKQLKRENLIEWQAGLGDPTNAGENACFLDGFDAGWAARASESSPLQPECMMEGCDLTARYCIIHGAATTAPSAPTDNIDEIRRQRDEFKEAAYRLENTIRLLRTEAAPSAPTATDWMRELTEYANSFAIGGMTSTSAVRWYLLDFVRKYAGEHAGAESKKEPTV